MGVGATLVGSDGAEHRLRSLATPAPNDLRVLVVRSCPAAEADDQFAERGGSEHRGQDAELPRRGLAA